MNFWRQRSNPEVSNPLQAFVLGSDLGLEAWQIVIDISKEKREIWRDDRSVQMRDRSFV